MAHQTARDHNVYHVCKTDDAQKIPAYGVAQISGAALDELTKESVSLGQRPTLTIKKVDDASLPDDMYVIMGPDDLPPSGRSELPRTFPSLAILETGGTYTVGDEIGPVLDEYHMASSGTGWRFLGGEHTLGDTDNPNGETTVGLVAPIGSGAGSKPVTGQIVGYLGDGWYRVQPKNALLDDTYSKVAYPSNPFKTESSGCEWEWRTGAWVKTSDCTGTCSGCATPGFDGWEIGGPWPAGIRQETRTQCTYPGSGCSNFVTLEWTEDGGGPGVVTWEIVSGTCNVDCAPNLPNYDGSSYGEQVTVSCRRTDRCEDNWADPALLTELPLQGEDGTDPDTSVSRQLSNLVNPPDQSTGDWFLAYQTSKMTLPPGTGVLCIPYWRGHNFDSPGINAEDRWGKDLDDIFKQGHFYQIVSAEIPLLTVNIPTGFECCPDGSILISESTPIIIEGFNALVRRAECP